MLESHARHIIAVRRVRPYKTRGRAKITGPLDPFVVLYKLNLQKLTTAQSGPITEGSKIPARIVSRSQTDDAHPSFLTTISAYIQLGIFFQRIRSAVCRSLPIFNTILFPRYRRSIQIGKVYVCLSILSVYLCLMGYSCFYFNT